VANVSPYPFVMTRDRVEAMLAERGTTFAKAAFGAPEAVEIVKWMSVTATQHHDGLRIAVILTVRRRHGEDNHETKSDLRTLLLSPDGVRLVENNFRTVPGNPRSDAPTRLWRIEDDDGEGPFRSPNIRRLISLAATDGEDNGWTSDFATSVEEGLDMHDFHLCATADLRSFRTWFPMPVRRLLADHGYHLVRLLAEPGAAQVGASQAIYDPSRTLVLSRRSLLGENPPAPLPPATVQEGVTALAAMRDYDTLVHCEEFTRQFFEPKNFEPTRYVA
jgi:hypothetical protein